MARSKEYVIPLPPIPWKRAGRNKKLFYDQQVHEKLAIGIYLNQQHGNEPAFTTPLHVEAIFYIPIPKSIKARLPFWCANLYDIDNLIKLLLDTCTTTNIWKDDRIISSLVSKKIYDKNPRTHLIIRELE